MLYSNGPKIKPCELGDEGETPYQNNFPINSL